MGKTQSKRSVDITTESKKGDEEVTGKLEKIEDVDQKQLNGDATPQESNEAEKKDPDDTENDKDLTTEKSAAVESESKASSGENIGDQNTTAATESSTSSPKEEETKVAVEEGAATEEISPLAEDASKKSKKEKVKKKWSFRSISFGRKDKQKPAKTEETAETAAVDATTNGEAEKTTAETVTEEKKEEGATADGETKPSENGEASEKELNGEKTPTSTPTEDKPAADALVNETTNTTNATNDITATTTAATSSTNVNSSAVSNDNTATESQTEKKTTEDVAAALKSEIISETAVAAAAIVSNGGGADTAEQQNGVAAEENSKDNVVAVETQDKTESHVSSETIKNTIPSDDKIIPHQNGTNGDNNDDIDETETGIEGGQEQINKSQIEVNTTNRNNAVVAVDSNITNTCTTTTTDVAFSNSETSSNYKPLESVECENLIENILATALETVEEESSFAVKVEETHSIESEKPCLPVIVETDIMNVENLSKPETTDLTFEKSETIATEDTTVKPTSELVETLKSSNTFDIGTTEKPVEQISQSVQNCEQLDTIVPPKTCESKTFVQHENLEKSCESKNPLEFEIVENSSASETIETEKTNVEQITEKSLETKNIAEPLTDEKFELVENSEITEKSNISDIENSNFEQPKFAETIEKSNDFVEFEHSNETENDNKFSSSDKTENLIKSTNEPEKIVTENLKVDEEVMANEVKDINISNVTDSIECNEAGVTFVVSSNDSPKAQKDAENVDDIQDSAETSAEPPPLPFSPPPSQIANFALSNDQPENEENDLPSTIELTTVIENTTEENGTVIVEEIITVSAGMSPEEFMERCTEFVPEGPEALISEFCDSEDEDVKDLKSSKEFMERCTEFVPEGPEAQISEFYDSEDENVIKDLNKSIVSEAIVDDVTAQAVECIFQLEEQLNAEEPELVTGNEVEIEKGKAHIVESVVSPAIINSFITTNNINTTNTDKETDKDTDCDRNVVLDVIVDTIHTVEEIAAGDSTNYIIDNTIINTTNTTALPLPTQTPIKQIDELANKIENEIESESNKHTIQPPVAENISSSSSSPTDKEFKDLIVSSFKDILEVCEEQKNKVRLVQAGHVDDDENEDDVISATTKEIANAKDLKDSAASEITTKDLSVTCE